MVSLQIIDNEHLNGVLNVVSGTSFPITLSISDVRDISERSGVFSKTIFLAGDENNNMILNSVFDTNIIEGTFNTNKRLKVAIIEGDGTIVMDHCYLQLLTVVKTQRTSSAKDNHVYYEALIMNELGNFFRDMDNKTLLNIATMFGEYEHTFDDDAIVNSWDNSSGLLYTLPWIDDDRYYIHEVVPALYIKEIFDAIHKTNDFNYTWDHHPQDNFDKMVMLYRGDSKKFSEEFINDVKVIVEENTNQYTAYTNAEGKGRISSIPTIELNLTNILQDNHGLYSNATGYSNPYLMVGKNSLHYKISIDWDLLINNQESVQANMPGSSWHTIAPKINIVEGSRTVASEKLEFTHVNHAHYDNHHFIFLEDRTKLVYKPFPTSGYINPGEHYMAGGTTTFDMNINDLEPSDLKLRVGMDTNNGVGTFWRKKDEWDPAGVYWRMKIKSVRVEIAPSKDSYMIPGQNISMDFFLSDKIKQSEFLKSIYQMFNLYGEVDPDSSPKTIHYRSRDKFYDEGRTFDWTHKIAKDREQRVTFIPELVEKSIKLTYREDKEDAILEAYREGTGETYGQVTTTFTNEFVRGEDVKEVTFSPTINLETTFVANMPFLPVEWKGNFRIAYYNGKKGSGDYVIESGPNTKKYLNVYPFVSMLDELENPSVSMEWGMPKFYPISVGYATHNNLYNRYWRRTMAQLDQGRMLSVLLNLTNEDIKNIKMNDKIILSGVEYYINKIIDYDMNNNSLTRVELLTSERNLQLPSYRSKSGFGPVPPSVINDVYTNPTPTLFKGGLSSVIKDRVISTSTSSSNGIDFGLVNGKGVRLPNKFKGIVFGDDVSVEGNGIYIGDTAITNDNIVIDSKPIDDIFSPLKDYIDVTRDQVLNYESNGALKIGELYRLVDRDNIIMEVTDDNDGGITLKSNSIVMKRPSATVYGFGVLNKFSYAVGSIRVWGGRTWRKNLGGTQTMSVMPTQWDNPNTGSTWGWGRYDALDETVISKIEYNIYTDIVSKMTDDKGNVISNIVNDININGKIIYSDINSPNIFSNDTGYIINNYTSIITNNTNKGYISGNLGVLAISSNSNLGNINDNLNEGFIANNSNMGNISGNGASMTHIFYNTNIGNISDNAIVGGGGITNNSNTGEISNNTISGNIIDNSNGGSINDNSNSGSILNNNNNGLIEQNTNSGSIEQNSNGGTIYGNSNGGDIIINASLSDIGGNSNGRQIEANSNAGSIENNSNAGSIDHNSNSGDITLNKNNLTISYNNNNGVIHNNSNLNVISHNNNKGAIINCSGTPRANGGIIQYNDNNGIISVTLNAINGTTQASVTHNNNNGTIMGTKSTDLTGPVVNL